MDKAVPPRSYTVETPTGQLRRNRRHLNRLPDAPTTDTSTALVRITAPAVLICLFLRPSNSQNELQQDPYYRILHSHWPLNKGKAAEERM